MVIGPWPYGMTAGVRPSDQASGGGGEIVIHNAARVRDELMALANFRVDFLFDGAYRRRL
jgi:hypothetical protein